MIRSRTFLVLLDLIILILLFLSESWSIGLFLIKLAGASGWKLPVEGFRDFTGNDYVSLIAPKETDNAYASQRIHNCSDDEAAFAVEAVWDLTTCVSC